jgi:hypothetical protein
MRFVTYLELLLSFKYCLLSVSKTVLLNVSKNLR